MERRTEGLYADLEQEVAHGRRVGAGTGYCLLGRRDSGNELVGDGLNALERGISDGGVVVPSSKSRADGRAANVDFDPGEVALEVADLGSVHRSYRDLRGI